MRTMISIFVLVLLAGPSLAASGLICVERMQGHGGHGSHPMPGGSSGGHGGHTMMMAPTYRLAFTTLSGSPRPTNLLEISEMGEGEAPLVRVYPVAGSETLGDFPMGSYMGLDRITAAYPGSLLPASRMTDMVVLSVTGKQDPHAGHQPGMPMPAVPEYPFEGAVSYFKDDDIGILAVQCKLGQWETRISIP